MHNLKTNFFVTSLVNVHFISNTSETASVSIIRFWCERKPHATLILMVYFCSSVSCSWNRPLAEQQAIITVHGRLWLFDPWRWRHYIPSKPFTQWYRVSHPRRPESSSQLCCLTDGPTLLKLAESRVITLNPTSCLKLWWPPSLTGLCNLLSSQNCGALHPSMYHVNNLICNVYSLYWISMAHSLSNVHLTTRTWDATQLQGC